MFLLIHTETSTRMEMWLDFTFHNVSINTALTMPPLMLEQSLHSTMFLLIPGQDLLSEGLNPFTFHNVSINTQSSLLLHRSLVSLHSTMFLLIQAQMAAA